MLLYHVYLKKNIHMPTFNMMHLIERFSNDQPFELTYSTILVSVIIYSLVYKVYLWVWHNYNVLCSSRVRLCSTVSRFLVNFG